MKARVEIGVGVREVLFHGSDARPKTCINRQRFWGAAAGFSGAYEPASLAGLFGEMPLLALLVFFAGDAHRSHRAGGQALMRDLLAAHHAFTEFFGVDAL